MQPTESHGQSRIEMPSKTFVRHPPLPHHLHQMPELSRCCFSSQARSPRHLLGLRWTLMVGIGISSYQEGSTIQNRKTIWGRWKQSSMPRVWLHTWWKLHRENITVTWLQKVFTMQRPWLPFVPRSTAQGRESNTKLTWRWNMRTSIISLSLLSGCAKHFHRNHQMKREGFKTISFLATWLCICTRAVCFGLKLWNSRTALFMQAAHFLH